MKLATCLLNISEARNKDVIYGVINAATNIIEATAPIGATVLNAFIDPEYNRSVITIRNKHKATINKVKTSFIFFSTKRLFFVHDKL